MASEIWVLVTCIFALLIVFAAYYLFYRLPEVAEDFGSRASGRSWMMGLLVPLAISAYGSFCLANQRFTLGDSYTLKGPTAISFSLALFAAAAALHFHFFWGTSTHLWPVSEIGKGISMILLVAFMCGGFWLFFTT